MSKVAMGLFAVSMLSGMALVAAVVNTLRLVPGITRESIATVTLVFTQFVWRVCLFFSPWVGINMVFNDETNKGFEALERCMSNFDKTKEKPVFLLGNHQLYYPTNLKGTTQSFLLSIKNTRRRQCAHNALSTGCRNVDRCKTRHIIISSGVRRNVK